MNHSFFSCQPSLSSDESSVILYEVIASSSWFQHLHRATPCRLPSNFKASKFHNHFLTVRFLGPTKLSLTNVSCLLAAELAFLGAAGAFESSCGQFPGPAMSAPGELADESTCQARPLTRRLHFRQDPRGRRQQGGCRYYRDNFFDLLTDRSFTPPRLGCVLGGCTPEWKRMQRA